MYFVIEGVIGVGKTTLVRLLQPIFQANSVLEVFEENPFLSDFYADRARYAFQTQIFFLLSRYTHQQRTIPQLMDTGQHLISDYSFEKDALFARINLSGDELNMYYRVHEALAERIIQPDLVVYLRASTDTLMQRIAQRDRPYERHMERAYIEQLNTAYDEFFLEKKDHPSPILVMDTNELNYVNNPEDLRWAADRIRQTLHLSPFQPELPISSAAASPQV